MGWSRPDATRAARCSRIDLCGVVVAATLVACGGHGGPSAAATPSPEPARALSASDMATFAQLLAMADARRVDSELVERALTTGSTPVRVEAILATGQLHAHALAPRLRDVVRGSDSATAATAAYALGIMRDSAEQTIAALGDALAQRGATAPTVAAEAAWALGEIGASGRVALESALTPPPMPVPTATKGSKAKSGVPPSPVALVATLYASAKLRPLPAARILPFVTNANTDVARAATYALGRTRSPAGARALLAAARSADADTRSYAARGLSKAAAGDSVAGPAVEALAALASDSSAYVRVPAIQSLATFGALGYARVMAAVADADPNVRIAAAAVLDGVLTGRPRADWERAFAADSTLAYRKGVVASALRAGVVLRAIDHDNPDRWQRLGDWRYRAAVAEASVGTPIERIRDVALPLANDPDGRVRTAAYTTFAPAVDTVLPAGVHPWRRQFMQYGMADQDFYVRTTVLDAMRRTANAGDVPHVLRSYAMALGDSQDDARVAAIEMLAAAWAHDSVHFSPAMRAAVAALKPPTDPLELASARGATLFAAWRTDPPPPHDSAWYRLVVDSIVVPALAGRPAHAVITSARGPITVELFGVEAPITVHNFITLTRSGFYKGSRFHRVVPAFVAQDGDPRGDGNGGPSYTIRDELNRHRYGRGVVGMALSGPDTGGSQYFLTFTRQPHLDGHYTVFGRVVEGFGALDHIVQGDSIASVTIQ